MQMNESQVQSYFEATYVKFKTFFRFFDQTFHGTGAGENDNDTELGTEEDGMVKFFGSVDNYKALSTLFRPKVEVTTKFLMDSSVTDVTRSDERLDESTDKGFSFYFKFIV